MEKEKKRKYRRQNTLFAIAVMITVFGIYFYSASQASMSDNVGMLIVPPIILIFYGPLGSFVFSAARAIQIKYKAKSSSDNIFKLTFATMPIFFKVVGLFGVFILFAGTLANGPLFFGLIFLPFWAVEYLF